MPYTPTTWVDNTTPVNAANLNKIEAGIVAATMPAGAITEYAGAAAPTGWVLCDGASLLRAGTYADLFAAIGVVYGSVDGTHFTVPDMRGRVAVGKGTHVNVDALADTDGTALADRQPKHRHTVTESAHSHGISDIGHGVQSQTKLQMGGSPGDITHTTGGQTTGITVNAAGASSPLETPAYLVVNYIIKY